MENLNSHAVAGIVGGCGVGIFATESGSASYGLTNPGGAITGNGVQVGYQIVAAMFVIGWNVVWTSLIMMFIKYVLRIPLRMSEEQLLTGDYAMHGEEAYVFSEGTSAFLRRSLRGKEREGMVMVSFLQPIDLQDEQYTNSKQFRESFNSRDLSQYPLAVLKDTYLPEKKL